MVGVNAEIDWTFVAVVVVVGDNHRVRTGVDLRDEDFDQSI